MIDNLLPFRHFPVQPHQFGNELVFSHFGSEIQNRGISVFILSSIGFPQRSAE